MALITRTKDLPAIATIKTQFGSLDAALAQAGYERPRAFLQRRHIPDTTDAEILAGLQKLHQKHGYVIRRLIGEDHGLPHPDTIRKRFGSMCRAYELAGLPLATHRQILEAAQLRRRARDQANRESGRKPVTDYDTQDLIAGLKRVLKKHGHISARLIDLDRRMPCAATVGRHFGSLIAAYSRVGWKKSFPQLCRESVLRRYENGWTHPAPRK